MDQRRIDETLLASVKFSQRPLLTDWSTPRVPMLALTPHRNAVAVPAESGTWWSTLYVWKTKKMRYNTSPVAQTQPSVLLNGSSERYVRCISRCVWLSVSPSRCQCRCLFVCVLVWFDISLLVCLCNYYYNRRLCLSKSASVCIMVSLSSSLRRSFHLCLCHI